MTAKIPTNHPFWKHWLSQILALVKTLIAQARDWLGHFQERLGQIFILALIGRTIRELNDDDATHMAAGVAYYAVLSLFPLTVVLIALLSFVIDSNQLQAQLLAFFAEYQPGSAGTLDANLTAVSNVRGSLGIISLGGLFWTASAVFGAVSRSVNRAWDINQDRPFYIAKPRHMIMALSVGILFLCSFSATTSLQYLGRFELSDVPIISAMEHTAVNAVARVLPFCFTLVIFLLIYKFVPNTTTRWRYIWPGAALAAVAFELSKNAFVIYLESFANFEKVYGSLGSLAAFLVWIYLASLILITGAEVASEYERMKEDRGKSGE